MLFSHLRRHVLLCDVLSRCLWSWTSWPWTRTKRCSGRRRLDGSSLRKMWRRRRTAGGNLTWPRCPSAVCWNSERPSRTVRDGSEVDWQRHPKVCDAVCGVLSSLCVCVSTGAVLLDLDQKTLPGIAHQVVEQMIISDQIKAEDRANVLRALLLKHRWPDRKPFKPNNFDGTMSCNRVNGVSVSAVRPPCHLFLHYVTSVRGQDHSITCMFSTLVTCCYVMSLFCS